MDREQRVRKSFMDQATGCKRLGSKFMFDLLTALGAGLDKDSQTGARILSWRGSPEPEFDAVALRLAGALHAIARRDRQSELSGFYLDPKRSGDPRFVQVVLSAIMEHDAEIIPWLDHAPQTNEVARSAVIFAGLCVVAERFALPIELYELGASGGLNLQAARYHYLFGSKSFGAVDSQLLLSPDWDGGLPPDAEVEVFDRKGCDLNPLLVEVKKDRERLIAYLWPDQTERIERIEKAIRIARSSPPKIDRCDAALWVEQNFQHHDTPGIVRVLIDTIAWNYFPQSTKNRITKSMEDAGKYSTLRSPIAWLSFEFSGATMPLLTLRTWPDGKKQILATADPHVLHVRWHDI